MVKGTSLALTPSGRLPAGPRKSLVVAGSALVNEVLDDDTVNIIADAKQLHTAVENSVALPRDLKEGRAITPALLELAKPLHRAWLPNLTRANEVYSRMSDIVFRPRFPVTRAEATGMLNYLFGAMGKRHGEDAKAKLLACADIFSPANAVLADALGLWKRVPMHPAVLALAIKHLMSEKLFEPAESELRAALDNVHKRLWLLQTDVKDWLAELAAADLILFQLDRAAWDAAYAKLASDVPLIMQGHMDEPTEDELLSPRWRALNELWERKYEEETRASGGPND